MRLRDIIGELETLYHPKIAEDWDNVGLLIGDENRDINTTTSGRGLRIVKHLVDELEINNNEITAKIKCEGNDT